MTGTSKTSKQPVKDSHCTACGSPYPSASACWPRPCAACGTVTYRNPLPVAVALLPVEDARGTGLVVITRAVEPHIGRSALPGGFVDDGELWQEAVVRELYEETGIEASASDVRLVDALSSPHHVLLFGLLPARAAAELPPPAPTDETAGWRVLRRPEELAFPLHTQVVRGWFAGGERG
ncbi:MULTISPECIES: NUDIX domain-containing protein [unclassified Streptomyces]|uniref:NUDIX domain-containing protein n=1 Tax=Streptomyces sp. NBC_00060 TaxID=2975636 RepID=A0AAU2H6V6_9ACTN